MSSDRPTTILMLSANPKGTIPLRLDEERREIEAGLMERSLLRDNFRLITKTAVRPRDFQRAMLDLNPQIVHFSGHGEGIPGLAFEGETGQLKFVDAEALAGLFALFADRLQCVVLNACYSEVQAKAIARHIPYVIGMNAAIGDRAAIEFAVGFYDALGAGRELEFAHKLGCSAIRISGIPEHLTPVLLHKSDPKLVNQVILGVAQEKPEQGGEVEPELKLRSDLQSAKEKRDQIQSQRSSQQLSIKQFEDSIQKIEARLLNPQLRKALKDWLLEPSRRRRLSERACKETLNLNEFAHLKHDLVNNRRTMERLYQDVELYLELIYYSLVNSRLNLLHEPSVRQSLSEHPDIYRQALGWVKQRIPTNIEESIKKKIEEHIDYLVSRLP